MFTVGQKVWWVRSYHGGEAREVEVTQVGRRWITLSNQQRCDRHTLIADDGGYASVGRIFLSYEDYERSRQAELSWRDFKDQIARQYAVPAHLSAEEIVAMQQKIFPVEPSTDEEE